MAHPVSLDTVVTLANQAFVQTGKGEKGLVSARHVFETTLAAWTNDLPVEDAEPALHGDFLNSKSVVVLLRNIRTIDSSRESKLSACFLFFNCAQIFFFSMIVSRSSLIIQSALKRYHLFLIA
jgi:hypothetical protein